MRRKRFLGFLPAFCLLALPLWAQGQRELKLGQGEVRAEFGTDAVVPLLLTATEDEVQGVVAVFGWDAAGPTGVDLIPSAALAEADTVVTRVEPNFMVLGVVMDSDPNDNGGVAEIVGPGEDIELARAILTCTSGPEEQTWPIEFVDDTYATVEGGPALDNIIVVGGLSIGEVEGLVLTDGQLACIAAPDKIVIEDTEVQGSSAEVRVLMDVVSGDVEGFVVSVCYDADAIAFVAPADPLSLLGDAADEADFAAIEEQPGGGGVAIGVVIDLIDPMAVPPNIKPGQDQHVLTLPFDCIGDDCPRATTDPCKVVGLDLCDGVVGDPLKDNIIVVGGLSIGAPTLVLEGGQITFCPIERCDPRETLCDDGIDNDCDGLIDADDPDCQRFDFEVGVLSADGTYVEPVCLEGAIGGEASGMLYLNSPDVDGDGALDSVQGFSLALAYPCGQVEAVDDFDTTGTTLESVGAEFVGINHGSEVNGAGDTICSVVLGVLVDAVPPFDSNQVIPGLPFPQAMGMLKFAVLEGIACDESVPVAAEDGVRGAGNTPVFNLVSVENYAYPATVRPFEICAVQEARFYRGDCNFSLRNGVVDPVEIADAAASVSYLFGVSVFKFDPPCLDACDANDDGRINIGDTVAILYFLFVPGTPLLPDPYPGFDASVWPNIVRVGPGVDPTEDPLGCDGGSDCAVE